MCVPTTKSKTGYIIKKIYIHIDIYSKIVVSPLVAVFCLHLIQDNHFTCQTNIVCNAKHSFRWKSIICFSN